ncbi:LysR substrate-binding domain-containing protein [Thalassolituus oleivorans]|uniref:LysR substrate-binding domain-containing protein n=1 Tax=Thalassolituus oleivorans TaxID=187493 RepID=UPI0021F09B4B|nr:LysR substrate-binding domain-containing protein [Thalassolituus oleivorans]
MQLRSLRVARKDMESALASGQIDFAADVLLPVSDQIRHQALGSETLVVVMRQGHPLASNRLNLDDYVNSRHILVSSRTEGQGVEDFALTRLGKVRQVTLRCQNYYAAVQVVANTDLLLTLPRTYAEQMQVQTGHIIQPLPLPLPLEPLEIHLYWHVKSTRDPAVMWMKEQMVDLF